MSMTFPSSPTVGQQYSVSGGPTYTWDGSVWKVLTPGQQYSPTIFTATAGQTTFTISGGYVIGAIDVFKNGVKLVNGQDYAATDLATVVLSAACSAGDSVEIITLAQILYSQALKNSNNLSDVSNAATARTNIGAQTALGFTPLNAASNLSDVSNAATARTNIGAQAALGFTPLNKAGDTITGDLTLSASSVFYDSGSYKKVLRAFPYNVYGSPYQWTKLGTVSGLNNTGGGGVIQVFGTQGYNALDEHVGYTEIVMYGSNGNTPPNNINGKFYSTTQWSTRAIRGVKAKSVNGTQYDDAYDIWVYSAFYTPNTAVEVKMCSGWTWTWASNYGTLTTTDPGASSNTLRVFKNNGPSYVAKAFVKFNGDTGGIFQAFNVSSVTRDSAMNWSVAFEQGMSSDGYSIIATASFDAGVQGDVNVTVYSDAGTLPSSGGFRLRANANADIVYVAVFENY